jgi:exopolyphosphatase/guanosine-5'-triphosphate,3'-diphosphate pyrophosphatase
VNRRSTRVAAIDAGTNTIRCLVGRFSSGVLQRDVIERSIIRLGGGLRESGDISLKAMNRALDLFGEYSRMIHRWNVEKAWAVGTSALRDSPTAGAFLDQARGILGFPLDVIDGQEEARVTSLGVRAGIGYIDSGVIVDIGGGSTELALIDKGRERTRASIPEGVVHLTERYLFSDPPGHEELNNIRDSIKTLIGGIALGGVSFVGTAGTPTTLAALDLAIDEYDPALVNGHVLPFHRITELVAQLSSLTSAQRLALPGMEKGREDLIITGAIMIEEFMRKGGYKELLVSDWGLLEGVAIECAVGGRGYDVKAVTRNL